MHLGIGLQPGDGVEFLGQGSFGKEGVQLAVAGRAEPGRRPKPPAPGLGNQMMHRVAVNFPAAQFALNGFLPGRQGLSFRLSQSASGQSNPP